MSYEGVDVTGARPTDVQAWLERGYVADWTRGSVLLAHFEPCSIDFTIPAVAVDGASGMSAGGPRTVLEVGVGPRVVFPELVVSATVEGEVAHLEVAESPCGVVWVRPLWNDRTRACSNGASSGKVYTMVTRTSRLVSCGSVVSRPEVTGPGADELTPMLEVYPSFVRQVPASPAPTPPPPSTLR